jgi:hypothetical protein
VRIDSHTYVAAAEAGEVMAVQRSGNTRKVDVRILPATLECVGRTLLCEKW